MASLDETVPVEERVRLMKQLFLLDTKYREGTIKSLQIPAIFGERLIQSRVLGSTTYGEAGVTTISAGSRVEGGASCRLLRKGEDHIEGDSLFIRYQNTFHTESEFHKKTSPVPGHPAYIRLPGIRAQILWALRLMKGLDENDTSRDHEYTAPAMTHSIDNRGTDSESGAPVDSVFAIQLNFWPSIARGWRHRSRVWPSVSEVVEICQMSCHMVHKPTEQSNEHQDEMYMSFTLAEQTLAHIRTTDMKMTYFFFKSIFYNTFNFTFKPEGELKAKEFGSYLTKTTMNWSCEKRPTETWRMEKLDENLRYLFRKLLHSIETRSLEHYWIPGVNLLKNHPDGLFEVFECKVDKTKLRTAPLSLLPQDSCIRSVLDKMAHQHVRTSVAHSEFQDHIMRSLGITPQFSHIASLDSVYSPAYEVFQILCSTFCEAYVRLHDFYTRTKPCSQCQADPTVGVVPEVLMSTIMRSQTLGSRHLNQPDMLIRYMLHDAKLTKRYFKWLSDLSVGPSFNSACLRASCTVAIN